MLNGLIILCAYLIGSIPSGLWIGKIFFIKQISASMVAVT